MQYIQSDIYKDPLNGISAVVIFLPPATKLRQGNVFTSVCQEFCTTGEGFLSGGSLSRDRVSVQKGVSVERVSV